MVNILDIKVDKNKTIQISTINFKNMKKRDIKIKKSIQIHLKYKTHRYRIDCKNVIRKIISENQTNLPRINSHLLIGLLNIKKIVFHSISLNKSWLQTNKTQTNQNISIIEIPKSTITLSSSQIVSFHKEIEKVISKNAKTKIKYKNLFLIISLKVFSAIFNILNKIIF